MTQKESQWRALRVEEKIRKAFQSVSELYRETSDGPISITPYDYTCMHRRAQAAESGVVYFAKKYAKVRGERDDLLVQLESAEQELDRLRESLRRYGDMSSWEILKILLFGSS